MTIGNRLREWRKSNNWKTTEISESTGISTGALSNYENDKREISSDFLLKLRDIYNADIYYILTGVKLGDLSSNEIELLEAFRRLPDREQIKEIGKMEEKAERYSNQQEQLSTSRTG